MAAHVVSFESKGSIEERKHSKREARQEVIDKAKEHYDKAERRKELKRQRGEDTWMLPEINQRLQEMEEEGSVNSKKKKEKKSKKKKEKKKGKKEKKTAGADDGSKDSSDDSEGEWVEAPAQTRATKAWKLPDESKPSESSRDEWMTFDFLAMKTTSTTEKRAEKDRLKEEEKAKAQAIEQAGLHKLELNPFWKDGGTGLPPAEKTATKKGNTVVNDAGLGWLRKSFQRMKEQAERQQRSLNEIVAERYGSMEEFQQKLADAEIAVYGHCRGGDGNRGARGGWRRGGNESRERWRRKDGEGEERERWRRNEGERDSSPTDGERNNAGRREERERGGYRGREEDRSRDGDRSRDRERDTERDRDSERDRGRERVKGRFLKPSEDDDSADVPDRRRPRARPSSGFLKPSSDDEDSGPRNASMQTSKKSSHPARESASFEKPQQERERDPGKTVTAPQDGPTGNKASASRSDSEEEEEELPLMSEEEMNKLGAKLVKAEIMGNTAMVEKLKSQLDAAHKAKESHEARRQEMATSKQVTGRSSEAQELLLFRTDQSGRAWPVNAPSGPQEPQGGRRKKKAIETHVDGERVRYFQDDDQYGSEGDGEEGEDELCAGTRTHSTLEWLPR
ncbi:hypothetical protein KUCAC02_005988 [Chaenocephalus aceratus]|uniref:Uncharacterized protein n=1 Tax=Chaenocephalus aceratus TaxID=36190 RepID=A0ACB9WQI0_CHAAC|nr:hypothetical protein KUCAC02_005988 [Chaenocephalus aceratus]